MSQALQIKFLKAKIKKQEANIKAIVKHINHVSLIITPAGDVKNLGSSYDPYPDDARN